MSWECRLRDVPLFGKDTDIRPGDMWFDQCPPTENTDLSVEYKRDWLGKRGTLILAVPSPIYPYSLAALDECYSRKDEIHGWTITGTPPKLTANPSINIVGHYHGWLIDGILSDDVEGRVY